MRLSIFNKLAFGALFVGLVACGGKSNNHPIIDGPPGGGSDAGPTACNVLTQMGCDPGQKCTWIEDTMTLGHVGCAPDGTIDAGGACMYGAPGATGYDQCKAGLACVHGTCKTICDQNGGTPTCDAMHSCQVYDGLFGPSGMEAAGVCDPLCNPLDDNDFDGSGSGTKTGSACGSADGCFGIWNGDGPTHFSCSGVVNDTLTNRAECTTAAMCANSGGNPYLNGCAAGYIPVFFEKTGSSTVICSAYCAPADCSQGNCGTNAANKVGASPHRCNNIDARGTFTNPGDTCVYGWWIAAIGQQGSGALPASPYNDTTGLCLAHANYDLADPSGMNATTTPWPECENMVASGSGGSNCYGAYMGSAANISECYGVDFGCVSTTTGGVTTAFTQGLRDRLKHFPFTMRTSYHQPAKL
jgi:hypothetical protein